MDSGSVEPKNSKLSWWVGAIVIVGSLATVFVWLTSLPSKPQARENTLSDVGGSTFSLFSPYFPANERFKSELEQLRSQGKLQPDNEVLIQRSVVAAAKSVEMPPSILWCLLFQESRLNHLEGIDDNKASSGLGQFSHFGFFEFNNHLERFGSENKSMLTGLLGRDVRPVEARKSDLYHPSSYYFIPTAVVASAAYLNNRFLQLKVLLEKQGITPSEDLLWFYATMAYNKGTRSVLSLWNEVRRRGGKPAVERIVLESEKFFSVTSDTAFLTQTLENIWSPSEAAAYARELRIHLTNMKDCTLEAKNEAR